MKRLYCIALFGLSLTLGMTTAYGSTTGFYQFENITEDIGRGFGDTWNRYSFSMLPFNGNVYVGTWNIQMDYPGIITDLITGNLGEFDISNPLEGIGYIESQGAEIWKHLGGQQWEQVYKATPENTGFRKMIEYNGALYAGTANSETGNKLFKSLDGVTWNEVNVAGLTDKPENNSIRTMSLNEGKLYVGTENNSSGGELWSFDGSNWQKKQTFTEDSSVAEISAFNGKLYVGTWDFTDTFKFYASDNDGDSFQDVTPVFPGSEALHNLGVMKLISYKGELYLGTVNYQDGFTLLKTADPNNPGGWEVITTNGLGDPDNSYTWSMVEYNGKLYLGTFNSGIYGGVIDDMLASKGMDLPVPIPLDGRAQLWCSEDGKNWVRVVDDGFGSPFTYGFRNMVVSDGRLYVGTASNFLIYDPKTLEFLTMEEFQRYFQLGDVQIDWQCILSLLDGFIGGLQGNWIGTQVWASSQPVPEPSTMFLIGCGLAGLVAWRKRSKQR
jgi:hypothetical protein